MENNKITEYRRDLYALIKDRKLSDTFSKLLEVCKLCGDWHVSDKITELENSYKYMLSYMQEGVVDPERKKIYKKFLADSYELTDILTDKLFQNDSSTLFYSKRRYFLTATDTLENMVKRFGNELANQKLTSELPESERGPRASMHREQKIEEEADNIFNAIWTSYRPEPYVYETIKNLLEENKYPLYYQCLFVTALTLNLMELYDEKKLFILLDICHREEPMIRLRALTGVALIIQKYYDRISLTENVTGRLEHVLESPEIRKELSTIQIQLIRSKQTEVILKKMNDEIIPEMLKFTSQSLNDKKGDLNAEDLDFNPEWEEYMKESGIDNKIKEISELQLEGADVLMGTFANLKSFPFFNKMSNWFIPFYNDNSNIATVFEDQETGETFKNMFETSRFMCNSDKYSFCLSILMLPHNQRSMMSQQFAAQINDLKEMEKAEEGAAPKVKKNEVISNLYLQDLYRFYKLFHKRADFVNIFDENLNIYDNPLFKSVFEDQKILELVAELYFKFKYYNEALSVYDLLIKLWGDNYAFLQKKGYCLQESGQINEALENYLRSDILKPDSPWTVRRIATCYRALKKHKDAIEYFRKYLKLKPDNLQVELNIGNCYLELKDYENALTYYFKVDYLDSNNQKAWRPIAWCSFVLKKYDQADRYYEKILSNNPGIIDLINAGHNKWASGNIKDAINLYKKGAEEFANGAKEFEKIFHQDKDELIMAGIDETDIYLMADQILYNKR